MQGYRGLRVRISALGSRLKAHGLRLAIAAKKHALPHAAHMSTDRPPNRSASRGARGSVKLRARFVPRRRRTSPRPMPHATRRETRLPRRRCVTRPSPVAPIYRAALMASVRNRDFSYENVARSMQSASRPTSRSLRQAPHDNAESEHGRPCAIRRRTTRSEDDDLLHVRMPLWHPRAFAQRRSPLHRRQPRPSAEPGRDLRERRIGHHETVFARAPSRSR
ncbi:molybdopterin oxidoreductase family domain protein [Burkholderia pseudomallei MSHR684]|nr:molybdopterin oxidoreductase family domain protein [Burkholderia pseudomallei MSHR684]